MEGERKDEEGGKERVKMTVPGAPGAAPPFFQVSHRDCPPFPVSGVKQLGARLAPRGGLPFSMTLLACSGWGWVGTAEESCEDVSSTSHLASVSSRTNWPCEPAQGPLSGPGALTLLLTEEDGRAEVSCYHWSFFRWTAPASCISTCVYFLGIPWDAGSVDPVKWVTQWLLHKRVCHHYWEQILCVLLSLPLVHWCASGSSPASGADSSLFRGRNQELPCYGPEMSPHTQALSVVPGTQ